MEKCEHCGRNQAKAITDRSVVCMNCGQLFFSKSHRAKWCGGACQQRFRRKNGG